MQGMAQEGREIYFHPWQASLIVFVSSGAIMVLELVAGRLMAPVLGVSLYTWTAIIGVILAGISLGNLLGGLLADRYASRGTLAFVFVLSAAASLSILWTVKMTHTIIDLSLPVMVQVLLAFAIVFFFPTPYNRPSAKCADQPEARQEGPGDAAGCAGCVDSTHYVACLTQVSQGEFNYQRRNCSEQYGGLSYIIWWQGILESHCLYETNYFCIRVHPDSDDANIQVLTLDRLVHSYVNPDDPTDLRYGYERIYRDVLEAIAPSTMSISTFFVGGGGYTFPRYVEAAFPNSYIEVAEIDPGVTQAAYEYLALPRDTRIISVNEDARRYLTHLPDERRYDLILGDAFNDFSVPYHLTTLEFNQLVANHLTDSGFYMVNIIDGRQGHFVRAYVSTLEQVFKHVYIAPIGGELGSVARQTFVIVAAQHPLPIGDDSLALGQEILPLASSLRSDFLSRSTWQSYLDKGSVVILTDDYVPVDNLLAPVFTDSGL